MRHLAIIAAVLWIGMAGATEICIPGPQGSEVCMERMPDDGFTDGPDPVTGKVFCGDRAGGWMPGMDCTMPQQQKRKATGMEKRKQITDQPDPVDCRTSPSGWRECKVGGAWSHVPSSTCGEDECGEFARQHCGGATGVFVFMHYPNARHSENSCVAMCTNGGYYADRCDGIVDPPFDWSPPFQCGECPGACGTSPTCCPGECGGIPV